MQTNTLRLLIGILVTSTIIIACASNARDTAKDSPSTEVKALPVDIEIAEEVALQQTETLAGSIVPNRTVEIMSELSKKVVGVSFRDGDHIGQGHVLYKLDDADIRARLRQLQAELNLAKINEDRFRQLLKTETVRQEEYDIAHAKLQSLVAAQDLLYVELAKTSIRAPFSGIIGITKVYPGTLVSPGMPMVTLQEQCTLKIQFSVSEKYLPLVKAGDKIQFSTELDTTKLNATVVSTEVSVDIQTRNITVQAVTPNTSGKLKAGMSVKVYFNTSGENARGIMIPSEALIPGDSGYRVFVIKNGLARITPVAISNRNEKDALISSGLQVGDTIIISNILRAADGIPVTAVATK